MCRKQKYVKKTTEGNGDRIFFLLVIVLAITTIAFIIITVINISNNKDTNPLVTEIYNYFSTEDLTNCDGLFNYSDSKVDYDKVNSNTKLCIAYQKANITEEIELLKVTKNKETCEKNGMIFKSDDNSSECRVSRIPKNIIDDTYKKIFGKTIENNGKFTVDSTHTCYLNKDYYYCGLSETFTYILTGSAIYRSIKNYEEKGSKLVIYDYFLKINDTTCYKNYTTNSINEKCTQRYKKGQKIKYSFMRKYATAFKHIYNKADDGTYYWVSSEPF